MPLKIGGGGRGGLRGARNAERRRSRLLAQPPTYGASQPADAGFSTRRRVRAIKLREQKKLGFMTPAAAGVLAPFFTRPRKFPGAPRQACTVARIAPPGAHDASRAVLEAQHPQMCRPIVSIPPIGAAGGR